MPGMNNGLNISNSLVLAAFRSALIHQLIAVLLIFAVLSLAWVAMREVLPGTAAAARRAAAGQSYPAWRDLLRTGFGLIWIVDGILQAQPSMAVGLPSRVIEPIAASSPRWVQHLVNWAGTSWSYHPIQAGASAVWIQVGIGIWLLVARRGMLSRLAGLASVGWGLVVWIFGESFGGIFAPGLTWLFGAPGAALAYCVASALIALPERYWRSPRLGRQVLAGLGLFLVGMAVLQAWPGRGFWAGSQHGHAGTLTSMVRSMAGTPQPAAIARLVSAFATFVSGHGLIVNLVAVIALAAIGTIFLTGRTRLIRPAVIVLVALCLADWVLIEDFGFFGGLGTDPNSMIPMALLAIGGYLALVQAPAPAAQPAAEPATGPASGPAPGPAREPTAQPARGWPSRLRPSALSRSFAAASAGTVASLGALGIILLGAIPMAAAQASPTASTILAQAVDGTSAPLNSRAPAFSLTDQSGRPVSLASLHGKVILLTFLDSVCVTDCPLIAQEFRQAGLLLGGNGRHVELVAVNLNALYSSVTYTRAFDHQEGLASVPNWLYLTGTPAQLRPVWRNYGVTSETLPDGSMLGHNDVAFAIDSAGHLRDELNFDPGPGTEATESSFAAELADTATQLLKQS